MTRKVFNSICQELTINPDIALENEDVKKFLLEHKGVNDFTQKGMHAQFKLSSILKQII